MSYTFSPAKPCRDIDPSPAAPPPRRDTVTRSGARVLEQEARTQALRRRARARVPAASFLRLPDHRAPRRVPHRAGDGPSLPRRGPRVCPRTLARARSKISDCARVPTLPVVPTASAYAPRREGARRGRNPTSRFVGVSAEGTPRSNPFESVRSSNHPRRRRIRRSPPPPPRRPAAGVARVPARRRGPPRRLRTDDASLANRPRRAARRRPSSWWLSTSRSNGHEPSPPPRSNAQSPSSRRSTRTPPPPPPPPPVRARVPPGGIRSRAAGRSLRYRSNGGHLANALPRGAAAEAGLPRGRGARRRGAARRASRRRARRRVLVLHQTERGRPRREHRRPERGGPGGDILPRARRCEDEDGARVVVVPADAESAASSERKPPVRPSPGPEAR